MELLEQSAKASADKLKFFRLAFGAAGGFGQMVSVSEARELIAALIGDSGRITLDWKVPRDELPKAAVKTLLNLAAMGIEALVRGGTLEVGAEMTKEASEIVIRAVGPRIAFDQTIGQALDGSLPLADLSSRTAPAAMIHRLAASTGGGVQWHRGDDALVMGAVLPHTAPHG